VTIRPVKKKWLGLVTVFLFFSPAYFARATAIVTPATGGSSISADTTGGAYTSLTGPAIAEGLVSEINTGTIILNVPSGFVFDTGGTAPTVLVTRIAGSGADTRNINDVPSGTSIAVTISTTQITFTVTGATSNGVRNSLTWQNVRVRPAAGTPLASGNITKTGTSAISGITNGTSNFGTLTEVVGATSELVVTTQPSADATTGVVFSVLPVVTVRDQFGSTVTSDNATTITRTAVLSTQLCGGTAGSGILSSTPAIGAVVSAGVMAYTAMQYSATESIKICFSSSGITSALSTAINVTEVPDTTAPLAISNLALSSPSNSAMVVSWTAPGDDDSTGTATTYDLRYATSVITAGNFSSATAVTGEPAPSVAGSSESMSVSGLLPSTTYYFAIQTSDEVPNTSTISNVPSLTTTLDTGDSPDDGSVASSGGGGQPTTATFSGQAYPASTIELLRRSFLEDIYHVTPTESVSIKEDGTFEISQAAILSAEYFYILQVTDKDGRKTMMSFEANLLHQSNFTVKDIFVPPTLALVHTLLTRADDLQLIGYGAPGSTVEMEIDTIPQKETELLDEKGYYVLTKSITKLSVGAHYVRVRLVDKDGRKSDFSATRAFKKSLLAASRADFNNDGAVNITDWSVFLFRWGSEDPSLKSTVDLDGNGVVDIFDLSVFLNKIEI